MASSCHCCLRRLCRIASRPSEQQEPYEAEELVRTASLRLRRARGHRSLTRPSDEDLGSTESETGESTRDDERSRERHRVQDRGNSTSRQRPSSRPLKPESGSEHGSSRPFKPQSGSEHGSSRSLEATVGLCTCIFITAFEATIGLFKRSGCSCRWGPRELRSALSWQLKWLQRLLIVQLAPPKPRLSCSNKAAANEAAA